MKECYHEEKEETLSTGGGIIRTNESIDHDKKMRPTGLSNEVDKK